MREANKLQGTGAWFNDRTGKLTASRMAAARAFLKQTKEDKEKKRDPKEASERRRLKIEILCERMTGDIVSKYVTQEMQWGIDQEPVAKEYIAMKTGWTITDLSFIEHPTIDNCGASPDGYIEQEKSLIEIKCPNSATMVTWLLAAQEDPLWLPEDHVDQMTLQSACMGGIPVWFAAFDPRLPDNQKLFMRKFEPTHEQIIAVENDAKKFLAEIDQMFTKLTTGE
jgi:hypothetical protein